MATNKHQFWNIGKANAEIFSGHEALDAALASAKISTLKVDGKDMPASDAPLAAKVGALTSLVNAGDKSQDVAELIASNGQVAKEAEESAGKLAVANAANSALTQENGAMRSELNTARANIQTLNAENAQVKGLLTASNDEVARVTKLYNTVNDAVSAHCLEYGCLDLTDATGKLLGKDASESEKLASANRIPVADKLKASKGAVNAAMHRLGLPVAALPAPGPNRASTEKPELKGRDRFVASVKISGR